MGNRFKSIALSAFVLPGLGQLYRGRKVKGGAIIMLDNLFILGGLFIALRSAGKVLAAKAGGGMGAENLLAAIQTDAPYARWVLAGFVILWAYSVIDAALDRGE